MTPIQISANYIFKSLTAAQVDYVKRIDGGSNGGLAILPQLLDMALSGQGDEAANVGAVSPGTVAAVTVTTAGGDTYADSAINTALASVIADVQANRTAINAILTAMKNAGQMVGP